MRLGNSPDRLAPLGGELKAIVDTINTEIPGPARAARRDGVLAGLRRQRGAHRRAYVFNGNTIPGTAAGNFFAAGTVTNPVRAGTIALDSVVAGDASKIAASGDANAPTDNTTARALSALRTTDDTVTYTTPGGVVESGSFLGFFRGIVTGLGISTRAADG